MLNFSYPKFHRYWEQHCKQHIIPSLTVIQFTELSWADSNKHEFCLKTLAFISDHDLRDWLMIGVHDTLFWNDSYWYVYQVSLNYLQHPRTIILSLRSLMVHMCIKIRIIILRSSEVMAWTIKNLVSIVTLICDPDFGNGSKMYSRHFIF